MLVGFRLQITASSVSLRPRHTGNGDSVTMASRPPSGAARSISMSGGKTKDRVIITGQNIYRRQGTSTKVGRN